MSEHPAPIIIGTIAALFLAVLVLRKYLSWTRTSKIVYLVTLLGYFFSILLVYLMPVDVAVTTYESCLVQNNMTSDPTSHCTQPLTYLKPHTLFLLWNVIYWTTYVCTWALYPLMQSWALSGEFTVRAKVIDSLKQNAIFYGISVILCVVIFVVLWLILGPQKNYTIALNVMIIVSSMWGLFVLICLLGFGLVFVPRNLWHKANRDLSLKYLQYQLASYFENVEDAHYELTRTLRLVRKYDSTMKPDDVNRHYIDNILLSCPEDYHKVAKSEGELVYEHSDFVTLHARVKADFYKFNTVTILFNETFDTATRLQDTIAARNVSWTRRVDHSLARSRGGVFGSFLNTIEWLWSLVSPVVYRIFAVIAALLSVSLVFSEVVIVIPALKKFSLFAFMVHMLSHDPWMIQLVSFVAISYIAACAYTSLFRLNLFNYYQLLPHQGTDENSILFSAAYLSRLVAVICLNFLHVINFVDTPVKSPFLLAVRSDPIQNAMYQYFPFLLIFFVVATQFNLFNRLLSLCHVKSFQFSDDFDDEQIGEGQSIMRRETVARTRGGTTLMVIGQAKKSKGFFDRIFGGKDGDEEMIVDLDDDNASSGIQLDNSMDDMFDSPPDSTPKQSHEEEGVGKSIYSFFSSLTSRLDDGEAVGEGAFEKDSDEEDPFDSHRDVSSSIELPRAPPSFPELDLDLTDEIQFINDHTPSMRKEQKKSSGSKKKRFNWEESDSSDDESFLHKQYGDDAFT
eukprot:TRINITY_DN8730_c0_g1_i1.p1 TRINITY_DN8730_c0_g1~~TRINITY_DN8730_c0_g1_i1.p1  ORF type:complete len:775 (-),score=126.11 TRINITY_DN8730_c0_g1_i1:65-2275(-)